MISNVLHQLFLEHRPRPVIPESLKNHFLSFYHDHPLSGHMGFHKVLHKVRSHCYWPKMRQDITHYIRTCPTCQSIKTQPPKVGKLCPITVTQPFELVGWDLVGPFPISTQGNKYILVITEYLTRCAKLNLFRIQQPLLWPMPSYAKSYFHMVVHFSSYPTNAPNYDMKLCKYCPRR